MILLSLTLRTWDAETAIVTAPSLDDVATMFPPSEPDTQFFQGGI